MDSGIIQPTLYRFTAARFISYTLTFIGDNTHFNKRLLGSRRVSKLCGNGTDYGGPICRDTLRYRA